MDVEEETAKFKWLLIVGLGLIISGCYSFQEMRYLTVGTMADGRVQRSYMIEEPGRRMTRRQVLIVEYASKDQDGKMVTAKDRFSPDTEPPNDGAAVRVEYLAGSDYSTRLAGHRNWVAMIIFAVCAGVTGYFVVSIWREGTADTRAKKKYAAHK